MPAIERLGLQGWEAAQAASPSQGQTRDAFAFKWARRDTYESEAVRRHAREWLFERYCAGDPERLAAWLGEGRKLILDAGCGAGYSALLFFADHLKAHDYLGVDISDAVDVARERFREAGLPGEFLKADFQSLPVSDGRLDMVFAEGVLHHTDDTESAFMGLARKLKSGGRFLLYVYKRKAVIREFTDDHVRAQLQPLDDEQAWAALMPITKLGESLGRMQAEIDVPEDIPLLGIPKGRLDLQRFFYWNICKLFYRPDYTLDEMNHVNFDWFRPLNCHRHTSEDLRRWCAKAGCRIERIDIQESGITVVAVKE